MLRRYTTKPIQEYTSNGTRFFVIIMPLYVVLLNIILFGVRFLSSISFALSSLLITALFMTLVWCVHSWASFLLKDKFPDEKYYFQQLGIKLTLFILFKSVMLTLLFITFAKLGFLDDTMQRQRLVWLLLIGNVFNISVTLLHDGSRGFDRWKATLIETEQLRKTYMLSQLMNLKSYVSPHFLFKNLDILSRLMKESPSSAETYLDELSKVYQYFLKTGEDSLVSLKCEVSFLHSYYHLIKVQDNDVRLFIQVDSSCEVVLLPPFTLQALFEYALKRKGTSGSNALECTLTLNNDNVLQFRSKLSNVLVKQQDQERQLLLENVIRKFSLLTQQAVTVEEGNDYQLILLPLIPKHECTAIE
ncbi:MAG TPA: histidine kinase [Flavisolibacter sp.]|nr:histidine kinase [Flavisolibacter sp.]